MTPTSWQVHFDNRCYYTSWFSNGTQHRKIWRSGSPGIANISTSYCYLAASHGQRSLAGYSPWGRKGRTQLSDLTNTTYFLTHLHNQRFPPIICSPLFLDSQQTMEKKGLQILDLHADHWISGGEMLLAPVFWDTFPGKANSLYCWGRDALVWLYVMWKIPSQQTPLIFM